MNWLQLEMSYLIGKTKGYLSKCDLLQAYTQPFVMYNLLEEREKIKKKLKELAQRKDDLKYSGSKGVASDIYVEEKKELEALGKEEELVHILLKDLAEKLENYKIMEKKGIRKNIQNSVQKHIDEINAWPQGQYNEKQYLRLIKIAKKMHRLPNFFKKIQTLSRRLKNNIINETEKELEKAFTQEDIILDLLETIDKVRKREIVLTEPIFTNIVYSKIYDEFSFHFFTQKETNRLDKPEWYFQFLINQLKNASFLCKCYDRIVLENITFENKTIGKKIFSNGENANHSFIGNKFSNIKTKNEILEPKESMEHPFENKSKQNLTFENDIVDTKRNIQTTHKKHDKSIHGLILRIYSILEIKINELKKSKSAQKRNLLFHFTEQYLNFRTNLREMFNINLQIIDLPETILKIQKDHIMDHLHDIHSKPFTEWFNNYKKIYKENFLLAFSYVSLQKDLFNELILFITRATIEYLDTFLDKMAFYNQDEKNILCEIISGTDNLKNYLRLEELNFILQIEQKTECTPEIFTTISVDITPFIKFIEKYTILVKKVIIHDITQILMYFQYFDSLTEENMIRYTGLLTKKVTYYFDCLSDQRFLVDSAIFREIDEFIIKNIVLKRKFNSDTLFLFNDFIKRIIQLDERRTGWRSVTAYQHLRNIFDGKQEGDHFFRQIYNVYQE